MQTLQCLYWHVLLPCFCPHRTLTSLIVPISILQFQNSFAHISWIYNYTHDVCLDNSCTVTNAAHLLCNIETQRHQELWEVDCNFWGPGLWLQHSHKSNASVPQTFHSNEKSPDTFAFGVFKPCCFLSSNDICMCFQTACLACFFIWISWLTVEQLNQLISWPSEWFL